MNATRSPEGANAEAPTTRGARAYFDERFGLVLPDHGWYPAPRYLLRRHRVLKLLGEAPHKGRLLEIGCGSGALLEDLARAGFSCTALESSPAAHAIARSVHAERPDVSIWDAPQEDWEGRFDHVVALEVLEHIEDDEAALRQWARWLKPGGQILLSVPCHMRKWSVLDVWAGHFRRYERDGLTALLTACGFTVTHLENFGYPLSNLVHPLAVWMRRRSLKRGTQRITSDKASQSAASGIVRDMESSLWPLLSNPVGKRVLEGFARIQGAFAGFDLGNGYLVLARSDPDGAEQ